MSFKKEKLESGLKIITEEIPYVRSVAIGFWVAVGARDESKELNGMSHFLEHLIFKGTKTRTAQEISETFDILGGELNAYSAKEYTYFYARLLDKNLPIGVEVLSDMLQNSTIGEKEIIAEKEVVLEEINLHEDTPDEQIHDIFARHLWQNHPLGNNGLGEVETVKSFGKADVDRYYARNYVFSNMIVAGAGNLKHQGLVDLVKKFFTKNTTKKVLRTGIESKPASGLVVKNRKTEQAHICYGMQGLHAKDQDRFALAILDNILGGGMSSRLFQEVREKRGLVYSIYSYHALYSETGLFTVYAGTRPSQVEEVVKIIRSQIADVLEKGIKAEELHRAKEHLKGQLVLSMENTSTRMSRLGKSELVHGEILSLDELIARIDKVELNDVQRVAKRIFLENKPVLAVIGPLSADKLEYLVSS